MKKTAAFDVQVLPISQWPQLASFLFERNLADGLLCLHSDAGGNVEAYAQELAELAAHEACYVIERANGRIVAALGAEFDVDLGRAWLRGPFLAEALAASKQADALRTALLERLIEAMPPAIRELDAFIEARQMPTIDFYQHAGFEHLPSHFIYVADRPPRLPAPPAKKRADGLTIETMRAEWMPVLGALHDAEFPHSYLSSAELMEPADERRIALAAVRDDQPLGYAYATYHPATNEADLDFLAVVRTARESGVGRALLEAILYWAFAERGASAVGLTIPEEKGRARSICEHVGFRLVAEGVHLRRIRSASSHQPALRSAVRHRP